MLEEGDAKDGWATVEGYLRTLRDYVGKAELASDDGLLQGLIDLTNDVNEMKVRA